MQISPAGLGIDPALLQRVMEAAGGNSRQSAEQDGEMRAIYQRIRQPQRQMA